MKQPEQKTSCPPKAHTPQLKVRSSVSAGASLQNCLQNLDYWRNQYHKMCGGY